MTPELSRLLDVRQVEGKHVRIVPTETECAALARRFGLVRIDSFVAELDLSTSERDGGFHVEARGVLDASIVQPCAVSAEDLPVEIHEQVFFRFVPEKEDRVEDEEIELSAEDLDDIEYRGTDVDLGEAVAQSLALAIDPFLVGPDADAARKAAGIGTPEDQGPFAALKGLKLGGD